MIPDRLLAHFNRITEAPDAIPRLRRFILDLAVRGKLVPQDPKEEAVAALLERIDQERAFVAKEDRRADPNTQELLAEELFWEVPPTWARRGVADLALFIDYRGKTPTKADSGIRLITAKNVRRGFINLEPEEFVTDPIYNAWMTRGLPRVGDVLFTTEAPMGNAAVIRLQEKFGLAQRVINFCPYGGLDSDFLVLQLLSQPFQVILDKTATGLTAKGIKAAKLKRLPLAVPPLAEQHRIVAKVDELMALCDRLEAAQAERESRRDRLAAASLHRLNNGADVHIVREYARFHLHHLPRLTTRPEHLQQLRQTILNLAVRGKLVPQDSKDEPVGDLLNRISVEQGNLSKQGLLKTRVVSSNPNKPKAPHVIPSSWRWVRLAQIISFGPQNGISPKETKNDKAPKALTLTATTSGFFDPAHYKHVDLREADCQNYWLTAGDVLFQRGNTREYVGIAAVFNGPDRTFVFPDLMIRIRFSNSLDLRYIHTTMISPPLRSYFSTQATGASSTMPKISQGILLNTPVPLPPLPEQHRIVAKVEELMALCDRLEEHLTTTQTESRRLLEAVLAEVLAT
jgi:type I restriction enzyme S subunit